MRWLSEARALPAAMVAVRRLQLPKQLPPCFGRRYRQDFLAGVSQSRSFCGQGFDPSSSSTSSPGDGCDYKESPMEEMSEHEQTPQRADAGPIQTGPEPAARQVIESISSEDVESFPRFQRP